MPSPLVLEAAPYLASACGLVLSVYLFVTLKMELRRSARRQQERLAALAARGAGTAAEREPVYIPVSAPPGFNLQRRAHALRLLRRGQDAAHIAAALAIPRAEVELLIRVERLVTSPSKKPSEGAGERV